MPPERLRKVYPVGSSLASIQLYRAPHFACAKSGVTKNVTFCPKIGSERWFGAGCKRCRAVVVPLFFGGALRCAGCSGAAGGMNATLVPACAVVEESVGDAAPTYGGLGWVIGLRFANPTYVVPTRVFRIRPVS